MEGVLRTAPADECAYRAFVAGTFSPRALLSWRLSHRAPPRVLGASLELPAGGAGVGAPAAPDGCGQMRPGQPFHEAADRRFVRPLPAGQIDRVLVQRNDVDLDGNSGEQTRQPRGVLRRIVDTRNQHVLHGDAAA